NNIPVDRNGYITSTVYGSGKGTTGTFGLFVFLNVDGQGTLKRIDLNGGAVPNVDWQLTLPVRIGFADVNASGSTDIVVFTNNSLFFF
ncbi:hypothetical protein ACO1LC_14010, partial [Staphylococcus aureus]